MRRGRIVVVAALVILLVPALAVMAFVLSFNPNAYAPDLVNAVESATGRTLVLGGPIRMGLSLMPVIEAENVSLQNPSGFADANFLTLQRVEAQIALVPLLSHRVDIRRLLLIGPIVTLETDKAGQPDWDFSSPAAGPAPGTAAGSGNGAAPARKSGYKIALEAVELQNGQLIVKNAAGAQTGALAIADLTGSADSAAAPLALQAQATYNGVPFTMAGQMGPVERFSGIGSGPWPVDLTFSATGATATINGTFAHPRLGKGYELDVTAAVPALEALQPMAAPLALPPIHGLTAAAHLADQGSLFPAVTKLFVKAASSDLSAFRPGLALQTLDIEMPSLSQPLNLNITGTLDQAPLSLTGNIGALAALLNPAWLPPAPAAANPQAAPPVYPVNLTAQAEGARIAITGGVATPGAYAGVALGVNATIPDLSKLGVLAGQPLPAWKNIALQTTLIDPGGLGLAKSAGLDGLTLSMDNAALGGDVSLYFGDKPRLEASLKGQAINLDALLAAIPAPAPPPAPAAPQAAAPTPPATAPPNPPPPAAAGDFTQSTIALPVKLLQTASADLQLSADTLILNKATYTALQTHAVLANGVLTINPLTAILPGGGIAATGSIDATKSPPAEALTINAPALALGPFLKAIDVPDDAQGTIQAALNATATGLSPHDMFSTLAGQLGLASVNGEIDGAVIDALFGTVLRTIALPASLIGAEGPVAMRCFALRLDATNGVGTIKALTLDSSRLQVQGGGTVSFGDEQLAVIIRPQLRVAGADIGVPVQITGDFGNPSFAVAPMSALQEAAKSAVGLPVSIVQQATGANSFLGQVASSLGLGGVTKQASAPDICPAALALGRLGAPGPAPEATTATPTTPTQTSGPQNLLNGLFGK